MQSETRYRDAVVRVLRNLPKYRRHVWEPRAPDLHLPLGSFDGYADTIESALYLVAREPVPEALDWIDVLPSPTTIRFDYARHRRVLNLDRNYVRLNEFPEWFVVDENTLYRLSLSSAGDATREMVRLGSELIEGVSLGPGDWVVEPLPRADAHAK